MSALLLPPGYPRIKRADSFDELAALPFVDGINAAFWERALPAGFDEVVARLGPGEGVVVLEEERLLGLGGLGEAGRAAVQFMLTDLRRLRELGRDPVLNCIHAYPSDDEPGPVPTDVFSFHADSAPVEADTWLCTYHGPASEGLRNDGGRRRVDVPDTRASLLELFGGKDDAGFCDWLRENCYDLHYAPLPGAQPWSFGAGNLWRIAVDWPGSPVPPCIHRAPDTVAGQPPRLLLIS